MDKEQVKKIESWRPKEPSRKETAYGRGLLMGIIIGMLIGVVLILGGIEMKIDLLMS